MLWFVKKYIFFFFTLEMKYLFVVDWLMIIGNLFISFNMCIKFISVIICFFFLIFFSQCNCCNDLFYIKKICFCLCSWMLLSYMQDCDSFILWFSMAFFLSLFCNLLTCLYLFFFFKDKCKKKKKKKKKKTLQELTFYIK